MRIALLPLLAVVSALFTLPASAEHKTFVIANASDGYGVDQCLTTNARCGMLLADAYCTAHDFRQAASFRKVETADVTGAILVAETASAKAGRDSFIAIECSR
ncbi:MAG: hypothetical protein AB7O60_17510 [Variibacter sp.]